MNNMMTDDAADLAAAQGGDHAAFGRLYDRHAAVVLALCRKRLPGGIDAEDALQETFIRAWRRLDAVVEPEKLRPWLYGVARFVCSERRRAAGRRAKHEDRAMLNQAARQAARHDEPAPHVESAQRDEALQRLDAAMDKLSDRERLAIHLYYLDADPIAAAATALGLSRSGYYKLLGRARERLAGLMQEVIAS